MNPAAIRADRPAGTMDIVNLRRRDRDHDVSILIAVGGGGR
jgi:hypothetical protein